jgi:hypothetical protein
MQIGNSRFDLQKILALAHMRETKNFSSHPPHKQARSLALEIHFSAGFVAVYKVLACWFFVVCADNLHSAVAAASSLILP